MMASSTPPSTRVLIVAEHASLQFGGEAALPLHYFRVLTQRRSPVWLLVHERTRDELVREFPHAQAQIRYIPDTAAHRLLWQAGRKLPDRVSYFTTGFLMRLLTQWLQKRIVKEMVSEQGIQVVHQPIPVSPKEPSMIHGVGAPVIIGPMNGGMNYPPAFQHMQGRSVAWSLSLGRAMSSLMNWLMPGKRKAWALLVANQRTADALPANLPPPVIHLVENGVDLSLWRSDLEHSPSTPEGTPVQFVFVGRLVALKGVDHLLKAFQAALKTHPMTLTIVGEGDDRSRLEHMASDLGILSKDIAQTGKVHFTGWMQQTACASLLRSADVMVLPSLHECGGAVVLEAMAMGKPVIATDWGGPADYLDEHCGILVTPSSADAFVEGLASAMIRLGASFALRTDMGRAGWKKVREAFDWEVKVDQIEALYQEAAKGART